MQVGKEDCSIFFIEEMNWNTKQMSAVYAISGPSPRQQSLSIHKPLQWDSDDKNWIQFWPKQKRFKQFQTHTDLFLFKLFFSTSLSLLQKDLALQAIISFPNCQRWEHRCVQESKINKNNIHIVTDINRQGNGRRDSRNKSSIKKNWLIRQTVGDSSLR